MELAALTHNEIIIGGGGKQWTCIRPGVLQNAVAEAETHAIVDCDEYRFEFAVCVLLVIDRLHSLGLHFTLQLIISYAYPARERSA